MTQSISKKLICIPHHKLFGLNEQTPAHQSNVGSHCGPWPAGGNLPPRPAPDGNTPSPHCLPGWPNAWPRPKQRVRGQLTNVHMPHYEENTYKNVAFECMQELHGDLEMCTGSNCISSVAS